MVEDLIQRLRACSIEERRAVAMDLAQTRNDEAVSELIRMAEGGISTPSCFGRAKWYHLSKSLLSLGNVEFSGRDQLVAVEALGKTENKKALDYLKKLSTHKEPEEIFVQTDIGGNTGSYGNINTGEYTNPNFFNAKGYLKNILDNSHYNSHDILEDAIRELESIV